MLEMYARPDSWLFLSVSVPDLSFFPKKDLKSTGLVSYSTKDLILLRSTKTFWRESF
jgi:hypothetical protein